MTGQAASGRAAAPLRGFGALAPRRHPGALAAMSSTPQPAARIPLPPSHASATNEPSTAQPRAQRVRLIQHP
jgi:hypothetical protein